MRVRPDPLLDALREETAPLEWGRMQISPEQGQLMELLVPSSAPGGPSR